MEVHFETTATQVQELSAQVEEALLHLSSSDLLVVGEEIGIRHGRLTTKSGSAKGWKKLLKEINDFVEKKCVESAAEDALKFLKTMNENLNKEANKLLAEVVHEVMIP